MRACLLETRTLLTVKTEYGKKIKHEWNFPKQNFAGNGSNYTTSNICNIPTRCSKSSLFFFVLCSTCFGRYIHPSSGASTVHAGMV
jgi:hypothetical protein